jgi:hypothetical protein
MLDPTGRGCSAMLRDQPWPAILATETAEQRSRAMAKGHLVVRAEVPEEADRASSRR